jgi:uncharacterized repeat protein (TIGR01451 family)
MRSIAITLLVLAVALPAAAEVDGASVSLISPAVIVPGQTYTFTFAVQNASSDGEAIRNVVVSFPDGFTLFPATMAYAPIVSVPLRPDWTMYVPPVDHTAIWDDANGGLGELYATESTTIAIDVTVAMQLYGTPLFYCVQGDGTGAEPHQYCGCVYLSVSAVEPTSWSAIKSLYR